jgi:N-acetylglucosaminyl-diphospho-decaprenol L-rhamnosyltransferase
MPEYASSADNSAQVTVSIVSHGHGSLVSSLLDDLAMHCGRDIGVILTLNIYESVTMGEGAYPFPVELIRNEAQKGFGANHNAAFEHSRSAYFCVLNPDIRIRENPFPQLVETLRNRTVGVVAPRILDPLGNIEPSARRFPTPWFIVRKLFHSTAGLESRPEQTALSPDWVAGTFMLFRSEVYSELAGFDERYFLYYEDVDLCRRLRRRGYDVRLLPSVSAVHDARRESRRSLRHLRWHLASMLRFMVTR